MEHKVWLTAVHVPGAENIDADQQSRVLNTSTERTLNKSIFATAISKLGVSPNIDLFASRLNFQIQPFVSSTLIQAPFLSTHFTCPGSHIYLMFFHHFVSYLEFCRKFKKKRQQ